jgi:N-acetylglutamate synthase
MPLRVSTKQMKIRILEFGIDSYERAIALWKQCDGIGLSDADSKVNMGLYLDRNPGMSFVAEIDKELVGTVLAGHDGRRGYIYHVAVAPDHRRKGVGSLLVKSSLNRLTEQGILKCHIMLFNNNMAGLKFWKSIGWLYRDDLCIMSKTVDSVTS